LAPHSFWLFTKIKSALKKKFQDIEDIQQNVTMSLKAVPQQEFKNVFNSGSIVCLSV
jgi:hypothetical protein